MKQLLDSITKICIANNHKELTNAAEGMKMTILYALYHYFYGDDDCLEDVLDRIYFDTDNENFAQGFFDAESYDEKILDIIVPYYVLNDNFETKKINFMISQTQNMILQMSNKFYNSGSNKSKLREYWEPTSDDKLVIKVITNHVPEFDEKNKLKNMISNLTPLHPNVKFEIVFGDEIEEEISQLTSDKKCVEFGELILDAPNNYLTYGEEKSIITNVTAFSLRDNYIKYGQAGLFSMNLRFYIANKKVDEGLEKSIRIKGENFWYYNNGIIIVCDDYKIEGTRLKLHNYSIVNGGQTTRMLGVIPFSNDFAVSCKVIRNKYVEDQEMNAMFVSEVAEASNTQKPINSTDIIANRYEQRYLKERLAENGIFMQVKRGDRAVANLKENYPEAWQKIKNDEFGQLIYAVVCQKPGTARNSKDKIFSDKNKYSAVFGNPSRYNMDFIKDLLYLKTYYKKWSTMISKNPDVDDIKKGLVKNGYYFISACAVLMSKFVFSNKLREELKTIGITSEKGNYLISQLTYNHRLFNDDFDSLQNRIYALFDLIYDKYISREFLRLKEIKPDLVYSNFTKVDKNYTLYVVSSIYDDFAYEINSRVSGVISSLFYKPTAADIRNNDILVEEAIENYGKKPAEEEDNVDELAERLADLLKEFRTIEYHANKANGVKAYDIFTNKELEAIVALKPRTVYELLELRCFKNHPRTKARRYGQQIVDIIIEVYGDKR